MLTVGTLFRRGIVWSDPSIHVEIQSADLRVPWRIVCVFQLWLCRKVAFKLYPIEPLNILLTICLDEGVQFTIRYAIERPSVRANYCTDFGIWMRILGSRSEVITFPSTLRSGPLI